MTRTFPDLPDGRDSLWQHIERNGYYPEVVCDSLAIALAGESVQSYVVHHEATFDQEEVRRHATVVVLTPSRLIVCHTDEFPPDDVYRTPYASSSTEAVRLERINSVVVTRVVGQPAAHRSGASAREVVLTIGWGTVARIELESASCGDPDCQADHGFTGTTMNDDLALRVSEAGDGREVVTQALEFAAVLSAATVRRA